MVKYIVIPFAIMLAMFLSGAYCLVHAKLSNDSLVTGIGSCPPVEGGDSSHSIKVDETGTVSVSDTNSMDNLFIKEVEKFEKLQSGELFSRHRPLEFQVVHPFVNDVYIYRDLHLDPDAEQVMLMGDVGRQLKLGKAGVCKSTVGGGDVLIGYKSYVLLRDLSGKLPEFGVAVCVQEKANKNILGKKIFDTMIPLLLGSQ